jgi:hypothetical protein
VKPRQIPDRPSKKNPWPTQTSIGLTRYNNINTTLSSLQISNSAVTPSYRISLFAATMADDKMKGMDHSEVHYFNR